VAAGVVSAGDLVVVVSPPAEAEAPDLAKIQSADLEATSARANSLSPKRTSAENRSALNQAIISQ
jgi:hypothetical protein